MNRLCVVLALVLGLLSLGCVQTPSERVTVTKYVCSDGRTTVADVSLCPVTTTTLQALTPHEADLSVCSGMPSTQTISFEDACIIGVAGKYQDPSLCRKTGRDQRVLCYTIVAELKNDPDTCLEAEYQASQCYEQYARDKRDGSVCGKITDVKYKDMCYSNLANQLSDSTLCDKITDVNYKDTCYSNLASQLSDSTLCDKIRNANQKDGCYSNMAMRFGDSSYCNKIINSDQKQMCIQNLQGREVKMR